MKTKSNQCTRSSSFPLLDGIMVNKNGIFFTLIQNVTIQYSMEDNNETFSYVDI